MAEKLGRLGMMLFCIGGSLEASPDAPWSTVLIPYALILAGLIIAGVAFWINQNYYIDDDDF